MNMITVNELIEKTEDFLKKHYNSDVLELPAPKWEIWELKGKRPCNELPGCYAMVFKKNGKEAIEYIGIGLSKEGIGSRMNEYHTVDYKEDGITIYKPKENLNGLVAFYIIGFYKKVTYLIPALEAFLIKELQPIRNIKGK